MSNQAVLFYQFLANFSKNLTACKDFRCSLFSSFKVEFKEFL
ncbi:hypothetical protein X781_14370 [Mannheimia sp. USDA-ARS-USMARC-1261]|nr:hypothetical protein X781_14370 [Mannheimia sp. USDA-ARS-USMARC-1261]